MIGDRKLGLKTRGGAVQRRTRIRAIGAAALLGLALTWGSAAHAVGADHGDWVAPPPGKSIFVLYGQHSNASKLYADGDVALNNAQLSVDVGILRGTKPTQLGDVIWNPQLLLPFGKLKGDGNLDSLGKTTGVGDLIIVNGFFFVHDWEARKHFAVVPLVWLPTGSYSKDRPLNLGENRFKAALQVGGQYPISERLTYELSGDITVFGKNKKFGSQEQVMEQKPLAELRTYITYALNPATYTTIAAGLGHVAGGATKVSGIDQSDKKATTTLYLQTQSAITESKTDLLLFSFEPDLKVKNGLKNDTQFRMRYLKIF